VNPSESPPETGSVQPSAATGVIDGGWPYIWGAYSVTWALLAGYVVTLVIRSALARPARPHGAGDRP
jgi:hypothetical protein